MGEPLLIYGTGGSGREIAAWAGDVLGFIDDAAAGGEVNGRRVFSLAQAAREHPGAAVVAAVGDSRLRERLIAAAEHAGLSSAAPLVAPGTVLEPARVELGPGVIICPGSVITTDIKIGAHAQVNINCSVTHDTVIGSYATLSPGVQLSGTNLIGAHAFLGTGAGTVNGRPGNPLQIGDGATVGAGALVTRDVAAGHTVVGVPARPLERA